MMCDCSWPQGRSTRMAAQRMTAAAAAAAVCVTLCSCGVSQPPRVRGGASSASAASTAIDSTRLRTKASAQTLNTAQRRQSPPSPSSQAASESPVPLPAGPSEPVLSVEPWTYDNTPGVIVTLDHHRLRTTRTDAFTLHTLPLLLDFALDRYQRPLGDRRDAPSDDVPLTLGPVDPARPLEVYLFQDRSQWRSLTRSLLGKQADPYLQIQRGGYAWGGRAVLMDLSQASSPETPYVDPDRDTLLIAAHEGWHQYTQRTFRQPLPVWLEEGLATVMEGIVDQPGWRSRRTSLALDVSDGKHTGTPLALRASDAAQVSANAINWPPQNAQRMADLAAAAKSGRLLSLDRLLTTSPKGLLRDAGSASTSVKMNGTAPAALPAPAPVPPTLAGAVTGPSTPTSAGPAGPEIDLYYAQVWALALWLMNEPADVRPAQGAHAVSAHGAQHPTARRPALRLLLTDAAAGRMSMRVAESLGSDRARASALLQGPTVFQAYFVGELDWHDGEYRRFIDRLVRGD